MSRKIVSILALLCFWAMTNYALAAPYNPNNSWAGTVDQNWFSPANWYDANFIPDITIHALIPSNSPANVSGPIIDGDAVCAYLDIEPWSQGRSNTEWGVDMNSGTLDCNYGIAIGASASFSIADGGIPTFTVHGGTVIQSLSTGGDGVLIGGGSDHYGSTFGKLYMYGGYLTAYRLELRYGKILLYGGTLECNSDVNFVVYQGRPENKIDISGGTLKLLGNYGSSPTSEPNLPGLIASGRIYSSRGNIGTAVYDGTNTILVSTDVSMVRPWGPTPDNNATNVNYRVADINIGVTLSWHAGDEPNVINHDVYFGTSASAVAAATPTSAEYMGEVNEANVLVNTNGDPNLFTIGDVNHPFAFKIATTYYWRVDENSITSQIYDGNGTVIGNNTSLVTGQVWNFTTQNGLAYNPKPLTGQVGLSEPLQVSWSPGELTRSDGITSTVSYHRVFFATSSAQASGAQITSTDGRYRGTVTNPVYALSKLRNVVSPATVAFPAVLTPGTPLYWRVDEVNGTTVWKGTVWSFTPAAYITIDDFEDYNSSDDINANWKTGYNIPSCYSTTYGMAFDVTPTGTPSYVLDADGKHMSFYYDNVSFSEVNRPYAGGTVFTNSSVLSVQPAALRVDYLGATTNSVDEVYNRMYVAIEDTAGHIGVYDNTPDAQTTAVWTQWYLSLTDANFTTNAYPGSVNMAAVQSFRIGFGDRCIPGNDQGLGGSGNVKFDNIRLYASTCNPAFAPATDLDGDCDVDINDLDTFVNSWLLNAEVRTFAITAPRAPVLWYKFNETSGASVTDYGTADANDYTGTVVNLSNKGWDTTGGRANHPGCIYLPSGGSSSVSCPASALSFMSDPDHAAPDGGGLTFSFWINADVTASEFQNWGTTIMIGNAASSEATAIACPYHNFGTWGWAGWWKSESPTFSWGPTPAIANFGGRWNHWAFVKEPHAISFYCNGNLVGHEADTDSNQTGVLDSHIYGPLFTPPATSFSLGTRSWAYWVGRMADFQVYDYALSVEEVDYLATDGTGQLVIPLTTRANFYLDGGTAVDQNQVVNFEDLSVMGNQWHQIQLWP